MNTHRTLLSVSTAFLIGLALCAVAPPARAAIKWSGDVVPANPATWTSSTDGYVAKTADGSMTIDLSSGVINNRGYLGYDASTTGMATITGTGSSWSNADYLRIGWSGTGILNIQDGGVVSNDYGYLGTTTGSTGTAIVTDPGSTWTNSGVLNIGLYGTGTLNIENGGAVSSYSSYLSYDTGATGTVTVTGSGSTWTNSSSLNVAYRGSGTLNIQNGGAVSTDYGYLGVYSGATGTVEITAGSLTARSEYVGNSGTGIFTQTGGTNELNYWLTLGRYSGSSGTYNLSGTGQLSAHNETIGDSGTGIFVHTGGTNSVYNLYVTYDSGGNGTYQLSGDGQLSAVGEYIGWEGHGTFTQTGGKNTPGHLAVGFRASASYELSGTGELIANTESVGSSAGGTFTQTAGTNTVSRRLTIAGGANHTGSYSLSGTGQLAADTEYVGGSGTGTFTQTGGSHTAGYLFINPLSRYEYTGGTLQINAGLELEGDFDFGASSTTLSVGSAIVNLSEGQFFNAANAVLDVGPNSLTIYAPGAHPTTLIGNFSTQGMLHEAGQTLVVSAGQGFSGVGTIDDHLQCAGTVTASAGQFINLDNGLTLSGNAVVDLGTGTLSAGPGSLISDAAQLSVGEEHIGTEGTGIFSQTGGIHTVNGDLYVGAYTLSGGQLSANAEYIGAFAQTGGTNTTETLSLSSGSYGYVASYELAGTGVLSATLEYIAGAFGGTSVFTQFAGSNNAAVLYVGGYPGQEGVADGTYNFRGGSLTVGHFHVDRSYIDSGVDGGKLNIEDASADIVVSDLLTFGPSSVFTAVPGSTIHMTGSAFENENTDPTDLAGLSNLELIYDGHTGEVDPFELAGEDMGRSLDGYIDNFALGALTLEADCILQLLDDFDNAHRGGVGGSAEALYLDELTLLADSTLDLNGLHLYYRFLDDQGGSIINGQLFSMIPGDVDGNGWIDGTDLTTIINHWGETTLLGPVYGDLNGNGIVDGPDYTEVLSYWHTGIEPTEPPAEPTPEPATLALLLAGSLALLGRRREA